ncbi:hypothetical protein K3495_g7592 [Podosphaera aphanis]|nr:hypothetical protein K3495_g7592 [Podosphaera aphanis]
MFDKTKQLYNNVGVGLRPRQAFVEYVGDYLIPYICKESGDRVNLERLKWRYRDNLPRRWISHFLNLKTLVTSDILYLEELAKIISQSCPGFHTLVFSNENELATRYPDTKVDESCALFLNQLKQNTLRKLIISSLQDKISFTSYEIIRSLSRHAGSLKELRIDPLNFIALEKLHLLDACKTLTSLQITFCHRDMRQISNLREIDNGLFQSIVDWICSCRSLRELFLGIPIDANAIVTQLCRKDWIRLEKLEIHTPIKVAESRDFLRALSTQTSLEYLHICLHMIHPSYERLDEIDDHYHDDYPEDYSFGDIPHFMSSLSRLTNLKYLYLPTSSASYHKNTIINLVSYFPRLEEFSFTCCYTTDDLWPAMAKLQHLRYLNIRGSSRFSFDGILTFIGALKTTNKGFGLIITAPSNISSMTREQHKTILRVLERRVGGCYKTFHYIRNRF